MELSMKDLRELLCQTSNEDTVSGVEQHGYCIAVLDKGFVYLGDAETRGGYLYIKNAKNIRRWTGGHGLSWYAENGFSTDIVLDDSGDIKTPATEVKHLILCKVRS